MKPKQSLEWIKDFESRYDDINYNIAGIDCWPIIRNTLLSMGLPKSSQGAGEGYNLAGTSMLDIAKSFRDILSIKKTDVFILSDSKFSEKISGSVYLKDSHVISEQARLDSKTATIALQNLSVDDAIFGREHCRSVFSVLLLAASVAKLSPAMRGNLALSRYIERITKSLSIFPMLRDGLINHGAFKKQVYRNIIFCLVAKKIFSLILRRAKAEKAYVVCYYSILGMALCAACRQLSIPITDIQHGVAGGSMRAYAGWTKVPKQGYTTLPDTFFCWTGYDAQAITEWARNTTRHNAVVVGGLWREHATANSLFATAERQWSGFFDEISTYKKKVLITMQSSTLPQLFVDVIKRSGKSYCFLVRAHPGFSLEKDENYCEITNYCPNVFFDQPSDIPIQVLMKHMDVHLTEWSGAVVDAYFEGVTSIVVSENALDYFEDYIIGGSVIFSPNLEGVMNAIE